MRDQNRYGSAMYGGRSGYGGYQRGMGLNARMNFQAYCGRYPRDCQNYMAMLAGYNVYFGKSQSIKITFYKLSFQGITFSRLFFFGLCFVSILHLPCLLGKCSRTFKRNTGNLELLMTDRAWSLLTRGESLIRKFDLIFVEFLIRYFKGTVNVESNSRKTKIWNERAGE